MNPFTNTYYVVIELSNLCNFSYLHKKCPASTRKDKKILPSRVVYDVLDTLGTHDYGKGKSIAFYLYSDSLNDPRLFNFTEYASKKCPGANIIIGTNGWYLNEVMAEELYGAGVTHIMVTAYTKSENTRLSTVRKSVAIKFSDLVFPKASFDIRTQYHLDSRLNMTGRGGKCYAPLTGILVCPNGKTRLCCMDIDEEESYGDVLKDGFEKVVLDNYDKLKKLRDELVRGERNLQLCKGCDFVGLLKSMYLSKRDTRPEGNLLKRFES